MADFLPRLDDFIPGYSSPLPPLPATKPVPAPAKPGAAYDALTPEQKKQADLLLDPRSATGEVGAGFMRGLTYDLPKMGGEMLQAPFQPGNPVYDAGTAIQNYTKGNNVRFAEDQNPDAHNAVTQAFAAGAAMIPTVLAPVAAAAALPEAAAGVGTAAAGAALFGGSTFTETYDKGIKAGLQPEDARQEALKTGAIMGGGAALQLPLARRFLGGAGALLTGKMAIPDAIEALQNPKFLMELGKSTAETTAENVAIGAGQSAGVAAVEKNAGIDPAADPYKAAVASIGPMLAMTALMGPYAAYRLHSEQSHNKALIDQAMVPDPALPPTQQLSQVSAAIGAIKPKLSSMAGDDAANQWALDQLEKTVQDVGTQQQAAQAADAEATRQAAQLTQEQQAADEVNQGGVQHIAGTGDAVTQDMSEAERVAATGVPGVRDNMVRDTLTPTQYQDMWGDLLQKRDEAGFDAQTQADLPAAIGQVRAPQDAAAAREGVAQQRAEADRQAAVAQAIVNPPEGAMTFGEFSTEVMKQRRLKEGELPPKEGKLSESALHDAYMRYMNDFLGEREKQRQAQEQEQGSAAQIGTPEGQGTLPLEIAHDLGSDDAKGTQPTAYEVPAGGSTRTNMSEAMVKAQRLKQLADVAAAANAQKQADLDKLSNVGRGTRMADLAEAGQITGNTPLQLADLHNGWAETAKAKGMESTAVTGDKRTIIDNAFEKAAGQKLFAAQLTTLRKARDQLPKNSEARDTLDAFVTRLEGTKNGNAKATTENAQRAEPQRAEVQVPGARQQGNEGNAKTDTQNISQAKTSDVIPASEQRPIAMRKGSDPDSLKFHRFVFEEYQYNAAKNPTEPINQSWLHDYDRAYNLAAGLKEDGTSRKKSEVSVQEQRNAQAALKWLEQRDPNIENKVKDARARLKGIMDVNNRAKNSAADSLNKLSKQIKAEIAKRLGRNIEELTPEELQDAQQEYDETVNSSPAYRNALNKSEVDNYRYDNNIELAVRTRNIENVLQAVEASPYAEWAQPLVDRLRALNLDQNTKIAPGIDSVPAASMREIMGSAGLHSMVDQVSWIGIGERGFNVHTVLHELEHAATVGHVHEGEYAATIPEGKRTAAQQAAHADLQELKKLVVDAHAAIPASEILEHTNIDGTFDDKLYGLTDVKEFLAEVRTNEAFQERLRQLQDGEGRSLWQRFKAWVSGVFGMAHSPVFDNVLEHALSLAERFETNSRFSLWDHVNDGPHIEALRTDDLLQTASSEWEKMLQRHSAMGNVGQVTTRAMLKAFTTHHLQEWFAKSPTLSMLADGFKAVTAAGDVKSRLIQNKTAEFDQPARTLTQLLQGMKSAERTAMRKEISVLGSEMSGLNVDLNKNFAANLLSNPKLENSTQMKAYINDLHARYLKLPVPIKMAMEQTFAQNRKNFIQQTATSLRNYLSTFSDARTGQWLSRLDIQDPALSQGTAVPVTAGRMPYYADRYTANLDGRLQTIFKEITNAKLGKEFDDVQRFYASAVGNPYQHLARMGTNFVELTLKPTQEALARVQKALSPFNVVVGQPTAGNQHVFMRFENPAQKDQAFQAMKALEGVATEPDTVRGGSLLNKGDIDRSRGVPQFARSMIEQLESTFNASVAGRTPQEQALIADMHQSIMRWALDAVPDTSARSALAQRNVGGRTPGYEADFVRNYATRAIGMSHNLANAYAMPLVSKAMKEMQQRIDPLANQDSKLHSQAQMVYDELATRVANTLNPVDSPIVNGINAFGYSFYLALSPAFLLTNLAQPYHLTLPYLGGTHGFIQSAKAMGNATGKALAVVKDTLAAGIESGKALGGVGGAILGVLDARMVTNTSKLSAGEVEFIKALSAADELEGSTQARDLSQMAAGAHPAMVATAKLASSAAHYTEVVNRLTAGLAGYNLELVRSKGDVSKATAAGIKAVVETQFSYSERNKASALGRHGVLGKVTPLLTAFQSYSLQTTELLIRMVRDATYSVPANATAEQRATIQAERTAAQQGLAGILGTTTVIAGTLGLPFASVIARLMDAFGDDDDPSDVKSSYRSWLAQWAGKDVAEALARGVPRALLGLDTSTRVGLQDILPGSRFFTDRRQLQDKIKDGALNMLGPAVQGGVDLTTGLSHMMDGRVMDGLTEMLPLALRGPAKALKMSQVGYTNATGNQLPIQATGWDEFVQSLGFTPSKKAEQSEANFAFKTRDALLTQEKSKLSNQMYLAIEREGTLKPEQLQELNDWNTKNPEYKISLQAGLAARAKARGVAELSGTDIATLARHLPTLERYKYAVTQ